MDALMGKEMLQVHQVIPRGSHGCPQRQPWRLFSKIAVLFLWSKSLKNIGEFLVPLLDVHLPMC